jgi:hypothetical protein
MTMAPTANSNESYCTFTLPSDVTAGGLPSQEEIAKDLESTDNNVRRRDSFSLPRACAQLRAAHPSVDPMHRRRS